MQYEWVKLGVVTAEQEGGTKKQEVTLFMAHCGGAMVFSVRFTEKSGRSYEYLICESDGKKFFIHAGGKFVIQNLYFQDIMIVK